MSSDPNTTLVRMDHLDLWKYFEERGGRLKDSFLTMMTWLLGFAAALVAFATDKAVSWEAGNQLVAQPVLLLVIAVTGVALVLFAHRVITEFGRHINRNFDRADSARRGDGSLHDILSHSERPEARAQKLPTICRQVRTIAFAFGVAFVIAAVLALVDLAESLGWANPAHAAGSVTRIWLSP